LTTINLSLNEIGVEGASMLADALKVNTSVNTIDLSLNRIGNEVASSFANALKVNTSVTKIDLDNNRIDNAHLDQVNELIDRNNRLSQLFLFDARQMLLSVLCADECGVVWPYVLDGDNLAAVKARSVAETLRAEFAVVVEERRRRAAAAAAVRLVAADDVDDGGANPAVKRRRMRRR
jgi:hypothetical protein